MESYRAYRYARPFLANNPAAVRSLIDRNLAGVRKGREGFSVSLPHAAHASAIRVNVNGFKLTQFSDG